MDAITLALIVLVAAFVVFGLVLIDLSKRNAVLEKRMLRAANLLFEQHQDSVAMGQALAELIRKSRKTA